MNLYEISQQMLQALDDLSNRLESGEISQEVFDDTMEGLEGQWDDKALAVGKYIAGKKAESSAIDSAIGQMTDRKKSIDATINRLSDYLCKMMIATGRKPKDAWIELSMRKSKAVIVTSDADIPMQYKRHIPESYVADKALIKQALEAGQEVPGAEMQHRQSVVIK